MTEEEKETLWAMHDQLEYFMDQIECMQKDIKNMLVPKDDVHEIVHETIPKSWRAESGPNFID